MTKKRDLPRVGAPDPELKNSPIFDESDDDEDGSSDDSTS